MMFAKKQFLPAVAVVLVAAVAPGAAGAATSPKAKPVVVAGVVIAREAARGTIVVASAHGVVSTLRSRATAKTGTRVAAKSTLLADGTYNTSSVARHGSTRSAHVRAVVVRTTSTRLYLSAGGSVFTVARGRRLASAGSGGELPPGTVVNATLTINPSSGSVSQSDVQQVGQTGMVSLEGTISALSSGSLVLAVEEGALTTVTIPASITLPSMIAAGDRVELLTQVAAGVFTLVTIQDDHAAATSSRGTNMSGSGSSSSASGDQAEVEAEGLVTSVGSGTLTVQGGDNASGVTFTVPAGFTLPTLATGDRVHARGTLNPDGTITLVKLELQHPEGGDSGSGTQSSDVSAEGAVTGLTTDSLTVQPGDGGAPVVFTVPAGFDVSGVAAGDTVEAKGSQDASGTVTLTKLEVKSSSTSTGDSSGSGTSSGGGTDSSGGTSSGGSTDSGSGTSSSGSTDSGSGG